MNDNSLMTFGKYTGWKLGDIPNSWFVWMYDRDQLSGNLKKYVEENVPLIQAQQRAKEKSRRSSPGSDHK